MGEGKLAMSFDSESHYGPIYESLGVDAMLEIGSAVYPIRAIDKTEGIMVDIGAQRIAPAATLRMSELSEFGIDAETVDGGLLAMNGFDWRIESHSFRPSPTGEAEGELLLVLNAAGPSG
jgi:hypothetical protein